MKQLQFEVHPHEPFIKRFTFSDQTTWETCAAMVDGKQCKFNTGDGKSEASICSRHTTGEVDDVLPQLDGVIAPEIGDDEESQTPELSVEDWQAAALGKDVSEDADLDEESSDDEEEESDEED